MRRYYLWTAFVFVVALPVAASEQNNCLTSLDDDVRIRACSELIRRNPNNAAAYNSRASAYASKGDYINAVADVTTGGELASKKPTGTKTAKQLLPTKSVAAPPKKSAPTTQNSLPSWARALFSKNSG